MEDRPKTMGTEATEIEVSRIGIMLSWLAVIAILIVVGAAFSLAVEGLILMHSVPFLIVAASFGLWLAVVAYRLVRFGATVPASTWADGADSRSRLP